MGVLCGDLRLHGMEGGREAEGELVMFVEWSWAETGRWQRVYRLTPIEVECRRHSPTHHLSSACAPHMRS